MSHTTTDDRIPVISRAEAKAHGLKFYFTGKPCKYGHITERYVSAGCTYCDKARQETHYTNNAEKVRERQATYRVENGEKVLAREATYRMKNAEKIRAQHTIWQKANPDKVKAKLHVRRARKRNAPGRWTAQDIESLLAAQYHSCAGCDVMFYEDQPYHIDHMIPLSRGGSNWPSNLQILCPSCNCSKGALTDAEWRASPRFPRSTATSTFACT